MEDYLNYITGLADDKRSEVFYNSGKKHAAIVMGTLFKNAQSKVRIWAGDLHGSVSENPFYIDSLKMFLKRGGMINIILDEEIDKMNAEVKKCLHMARLLDPKSVSIRMSKFFCGVVYSDTEKYDHIHYAVADDSMYRIELNTQEYLAKGNFNDKEMALALTGHFDNVFNNDASSKDVTSLALS